MDSTSTKIFVQSARVPLASRAKRRNIVAAAGMMDEKKFVIELTCLFSRTRRFGPPSPELLALSSCEIIERVNLTQPRYNFPEKNGAWKIFEYKRMK